MLLDRAARSTVGNFSTLFLVCMIVMLPLELTYAVLHHKAIATRELHGYIEELPAGEKVRGVGPSELDSARRDRAIVIVVELLLLPLLLSAARRALEDAEAGGVPTATGAWRRGLAPFRPGPFPPGSSSGAVLTGVVFALFVGFAAYQAGRLVAEAFPDRYAFGILGPVEAAARSLALPWLLVIWIEAGRGKHA
jgi:hypothetical protein